MITRLLKLFVYAFIVFFAIAGLISMKDKFMKFDSNESFEEEEEKKKNDSNDEVEEDTTDDQPKPSLQSATEDSSQNDDELMGHIDEKICNPDVVRQIKINFVTKFNNFKNNLNNDLNTFQRVLERDIHNMFMEKNEENENNTPKEGVDPIIMYESSENVDLSDDEEEELKETFIQDIYDGITSPYCLNCKEL